MSAYFDRYETYRKQEGLDRLENRNGSHTPPKDLDTTPIALHPLLSAPAVTRVLKAKGATVIQQLPLAPVVTPVYVVPYDTQTDLDAADPASTAYNLRRSDVTVLTIMGLDTWLSEGRLPTLGSSHPLNWPRRYAVSVPEGERWDVVTCHYAEWPARVALRSMHVPNARARRRGWEPLDAWNMVPKMGWKGIMESYTGTTALFLLPPNDAWMAPRSARFKYHLDHRRLTFLRDARKRGVKFLHHSLLVECLLAGRCREPTPRDYLSNAEIGAILAAPAAERLPGNSGHHSLEWPVHDRPVSFDDILPITQTMDRIHALEFLSTLVLFAGAYARGDRTWRPPNVVERLPKELGALVVSSFDDMWVQLTAILSSNPPGVAKVLSLGPSRDQCFAVALQLVAGYGQNIDDGLKYGYCDIVLVQIEGRRVLGRVVQYFEGPNRLCVEVLGVVWGALVPFSVGLEVSLARIARINLNPAAICALGPPNLPFGEQTLEAAAQSGGVSGLVSHFAGMSISATAPTTPATLATAASISEPAKAAAETATSPVRTSAKRPFHIATTLPGRTPTPGAGRSGRPKIDVSAVQRVMDRIMATNEKMKTGGSAQAARKKRRTQPSQLAQAATRSAESDNLAATAAALAASATAAARALVTSKDSADAAVYATAAATIAYTTAIAAKIASSAPKAAADVVIESARAAAMIVQCLAATGGDSTARDVVIQEISETAKSKTLGPIAAVSRVESHLDGGMGGW